MKHMALVAVVGLVVAGCQIEERLAWSPDGRRAAAWADGCLCLADPDGRIEGPFLSNVTAAAWLNDSRRLAVVRTLTAGSWDRLSAWLPPEERVPVEQAAVAAIPLLHAALNAAAGNPDLIESNFLAPMGIRFDNTAAASAALLCARDTRPDEWRALVARIATNGTDGASSGDEIEVQVRELGVWTVGGEAGHPMAWTVAMRSLHPIAHVRAHPLHPAVAFVHGERLKVLAFPAGSAAPVPPVTVADRTSGRFDWTADGRALVCAVPVATGADSGALQIANIEEIPVRLDGAAVAVEPGRSIVTAAFPFPPRLCCLPDGRILTAALPFRLPQPTPAGSAPSTLQPRLFLLSPAGAGGTADVVPVAATNLPTDLRDFVPSPDGKQVAIVESGSDTVAVLDLASGGVRVISPRRNAQSRTMPAWRDEDLFFVALPAEGGRRADWMRWRRGAAEPWSSQWPDERVSGLLSLPPRQSPSVRTD